MAKTPDDPNAPQRPKQKPARDPAKHSKKDPARPTRAKAARPEQPPMEPTLADLLNPGIGQGTAGPGSQTGLKPPPDNSFDRRADFSAAHRARKSTAQGLGEAPQTPTGVRGWANSIPTWRRRSASTTTTARHRKRRTRKPRRAIRGARRCAASPARPRPYTRSRR